MRSRLDLRVECRSLSCRCVTVDLDGYVFTQFRLKRSVLANFAVGVHICKILWVAGICLASATLCAYVAKQRLVAQVNDLPQLAVFSGKAGGCNFPLNPKP